MSKQPVVIARKNYARPLVVFGEHAAVFASGLKEDVRSWYELHRRNGATNVVVWAIYLELLLMLVLLVLLPFDTVQVGGRYRLIKPLNFTMSMAMYLATVVILLDYLRASMWWKKVIGWGISISILTAITCITMQAARGTASHFNNSTPFDSAVSSVMDIVDPVNERCAPRENVRLQGSPRGAGRGLQLT